MKAIVNRLHRFLYTRLKHFSMNRRVKKMDMSLATLSPKPEKSPIVFFNASTRLKGISLNAAFSLLTGWSLRLKGIPVINFVCKKGMSLCVLGTDRKRLDRHPPCRSCVYQSKALFGYSNNTWWFSFSKDETLDKMILDLDVAGLSEFTYQNVPLGEIILPSARWILRRHNLLQNSETEIVLRQYIRSAWSIKLAISDLFNEVNPQAVVVFNGMMYPEAMVRYVANQYNIPATSHEVGMMPFSAFFTKGEATAYPISMSQDFQMSNEQNDRLDLYLSKRFKGKFSMAGQQFWPEMTELNSQLMRTLGKFKQFVPIFTNVIFDTSQPHANVLFKDMFDWLDHTVKIVQNHPETLFIIRAHPDEARVGKASEESVTDWYKKNKAKKIPNLLLIGPNEYFSSYEMINKAKFVMIYNSTIGLEASIMGKPVLCAGKARFTSHNTVFFPQSITEYLQFVNNFLDQEEIDVPKIFQSNARRFLYYQLFKTSIPFDRFLEDDGVWKGYVQLKDFPLELLLPENSKSLQTFYNGILLHKKFVLEED